MFKIIQGQISLVQYFIIMLISTMCLVAVVAAAYFLPHDKTTVAGLVMILSTISIGSSSSVISQTLHNDKQQ